MANSEPSLVGIYERALGWLRSPRGRTRRDQRVMPVSVDLVGARSEPPPAALAETQAASASPQPFQAPAANGSANGSASGSALAPRPDWQFNQPALLRKSGRASGLIVWTALGAIGAFGLWAVFAPLGETIAVQGKLQPGSKVKTIQAPVAGVIETILVKDGQAVTQGQVLIRFDLREARSRLTAAEAIRDRLVNENQILSASLGDSQASGLSANQRLQLSNQAEDLRTKRLVAEEQLRASEARIEGLRLSLATASNIAERYSSLSSTGAVSEVQALQSRNTADEIRTNLATELRTAASLQAALQNATAAPGAELRGRIETNLRQIADLDGQIRLARVQLQYSVLTAPSDGSVFDINVSPGSVVEAANPLMSVVPGDALEAKVYIPNSAIGYLTPGQIAEISIDTFPSSDFGRIPARVERIGSDALTTEEMAQTLQSEAKGLFYPAVLRLQRQSLQGSTRPIPLKPGMALTADIQLRQRTFMSIFTSFLNDKRRDLERLR